MNYSIKYNKNFKYYDVLDEVIFNFNKYSDKIVEEIGNSKWKNMRVVLDITSCDDSQDILPALNMCKKKHPNLVIKLMPSQKMQLKKIKENNFSFFFDTFVNTQDEVYGIIQKGASDIYITESLAFNIKTIGQFCKKKGVRVRVIPNIAQHSLGYSSEIPDIYKFFIRPEDVKYYEPYVDTFELLTKENKTNVVFEVYKNEVWRGDLSLLIDGISDSINNQCLLPDFGQIRLNCEQICMYEQCNLCKKHQAVSKVLEEMDTYIKNPENKEWQKHTNIEKERENYLKTIFKDSREVKY